MRDSSGVLMKRKMRKLSWSVFLGVSALTVISPFMGAPWGYAAEGEAVLECQHLPVLIQSFLKNHYSIHQLSGTLRERAVEQFIKGIDPSKTLLLDGESQELRKSLLKVFDSMRQGDCSAANAAYDIIIRRAEEDETQVKLLMADKAFKIDDNTELVLNPDKRGYAKTSDER